MGPKIVAKSNILDITISSSSVDEGISKGLLDNQFSPNLDSFREGTLRVTVTRTTAAA